MFTTLDKNNGEKKKEWDCYRTPPPLGLLFCGTRYCCRENIPLPICSGLNYSGFCLLAADMNCGSQCQSLVKRKGIIYSKVIQVQSNGGMLSLNFKVPLKLPQTHIQSLLLLPNQVSQGYCLSGKKWNLQLGGAPIFFF